MVLKYQLLFLLVSVGCCAAAKSSNGEGCILKTQDSDDEYGVCTAYSDCAYAKEESCFGHAPQRCSSFKADSSVCCRVVDSCPPLPPSVITIPLTGYKAWDYCAGIVGLAHQCEYLGDDRWSRVDACPQPPDRNATEATVQTGEYPHLVLLSNAQDEAGIVWTASTVIAGTLISDRWVLSCATALSIRTYAKVGGIADGGAVHKIKKIIPHPDYHSPSVHYNVGLVELEESVTFSKNVLPACLHTGNVLPKEKLKEISRQTSIYYSWDVTITSNEECVDAYFDYETILPGGVDEHTQFCSKRANGNMGASLNGAPQQVYNGASVACTQTVFGVFASLQQIPLITRVAAYVPWIETIVWS